MESLGGGAVEPCGYGLPVGVRVHKARLAYEDRVRMPIV